MRKVISTAAALVLLAGCEWFGMGEEDCEALAGPIEDVLVLEDRCYLVQDSLHVQGALDVPPGADLQFDEDASLVVDPGGALTAGGDRSRPARFRGGSGTWGGIDVLEDGNASLSGVSVEDGGFGDHCGEPRACLNIDETATVDLQDVGFEGCAREGVEGPVAFGQNVGCGEVGVCVDDQDSACLSGADDGVYNDEPDWCAMYDWCEHEAQDDFGPRNCGDAGPGESRCAGSVIESCLDGEWTELTDCAQFTGGRTACRNPDGFPRCGLPAPTECLNMPELPGGSFVPPCDDEGCGLYTASCTGESERESCNGAPMDLVGCLHPETTFGAFFTGLGPRWMRLLLYNWGGTPDTSPSDVHVVFDSEGEYTLHIWAPPRGERNFCGWMTVGHRISTKDQSDNGMPISTRLTMPPAGEQQEIILEVRPNSVGVHGWRDPDGKPLGPDVTYDMGQEPLLYRTYGPNRVYPMCHRFEEASVRFPSEVQDICVNGEGRFTKNGEVLEGWPDLSAPQPHADPELTKCDTWDIGLEYVDD